MSMADDTMHATTQIPTSTLAPESYAQGLYARVLSQWTLDLLHVRAHKLDVPSPRKGEGVTGIPYAPASSAGLPLPIDCEQYLRWQPQRKAA